MTDDRRARVRSIDCGVDGCGWRGVEHYHALAAEPPALDALRAAVVAFYNTPHTATMDEATHLPVWHVPDHSYGELRRAVDALTDPTQRRPGEYPEAAEPPALDVERLYRAMVNIDIDDAGISTRPVARALAAEYARLAREETP